MEKGFILKCKNCGKEIELQDEKGYCIIDGITVFETVENTIEITCDCGNKIVM